MPTVNGLYKQPYCLALGAGTALLLSLTGGMALAANADPAFTLQAKPSICVSYNNDEPCTMALELSWKGPLKPELCVHELMRSPALQCWQNSVVGSLTLNFANTADVHYLLDEAATNFNLATTTVKVINRDLRSSRTRRRHIWSIF